MPSTRLLQWIEQAEAREVVTDALFWRGPAAPWRKPAREIIVQGMSRIGRRVSYWLVPAWPAMQAQPALVRRARRQERARDEGYYR